jgi:hypothetical protein
MLRLASGIRVGHHRGASGDDAARGRENVAEPSGQGAGRRSNGLSIWDYIGMGISIFITSLIVQSCMRGCGSPSRATVAAPPPARPGTTLRGGWWEVTLARDTQTVTIDGVDYWRYALTVRNHDAEPHDASGDVTLVLNDGSEEGLAQTACFGAPPAAMRYCPDDLTAKSAVPPGGSVSGTVTFLADPDRRPVELRFDDVGAYLRWKVTAGR